jgi:HK97 family phage prohead protease
VAYQGDPIPFVWAHSWLDPMAFLGGIDPRDVSEDERGLRVIATIDDPTPFAEQVIRLLKSRRVTQFSFSYDIVKERRGKDGANELVELSLIECGPCLVAANDETELISAKQLMDELTKHSIGGPRPWPDSDTVSAIADIANVGAHLVAQHERFPEEMTGLADERLQNLHRAVHGRLGDATGHTHPALRELVDVMDSPKALLAELDRLDIKRQPKKTANVDAFVTAVRQQMLEEAVETSRDLAWREMTDELATHPRDIPAFMAEVTAGPESTDEPEEIEGSHELTEPEVFRGVQIVQVSRDE